MFVLLARPGFDQDSAHIVSPSLVSKKLHLRINDGSQHSQRKELQIKKILKTIIFVPLLAVQGFYLMLVLAEYFLSLLLLPDKFPRHLYFVDKRQSGIKTLQFGVLRSETREREIQIIPLNPNPSDRTLAWGRYFIILH